jgi:AraC-like DNA-binding protein
MFRLADFATPFGYDSAAAFGTAFKQCFGVSPAALG